MQKKKIFWELQVERIVIQLSELTSWYFEQSLAVHLLFLYLIRNVSWKLLLTNVFFFVFVCTKLGIINSSMRLDN